MECKKLKRIEDPQQNRLFDLAGDYLSDRQRGKLEEGMHGVFRRLILRLMPVDELGKHLSEKTGRPSMELYAVSGLILFQDWHGWTDDETVRRYNYDLSLQYALNVDGSYREVSLRTLQRYQQKFRCDDLGSRVFESVTTQLIGELGISVAKQRLDSTHVFSNMALWGRKQLCYNVIKRFLTQVKRHESKLYYELDEIYRDRYEKDSGWIFGEPGIKNTRYRGHVCDNLEQLGIDMDRLITKFEKHPKLSNMSTFKDIVRVFGEQYLVDDSKVKLNAHPGGGTLQNPSDSEAGIGHKGQGYQVQVAETCGEVNPVQLVTCVIPEKANASDQNAMAPVLEKLQESGLEAEEMLADGGYGSDDNVQLAAAQNTNLVAPAGGKKSDGFGLENFEFDAENRIVSCPLKCRPLKKEFKDGKGRALFDAKTCANCPNLKGCPAQKSGKYNYKIEYTDKDLRVARRRAYEQTPEFKENYRIRGGIEGTFGREKHYGPLQRLRVRGQKAVHNAIYLIWAGHNIMQAARFFKTGFQNA